MPDYTIDKIPDFPANLKGNSAEGNVLQTPMQGFGKYADFSRPGEHENSQDALGAFIQGNNPANSTAAGKEMSANEVFNPTEKVD